MINEYKNISLLFALILFISCNNKYTNSSGRISIETPQLFAPPSKKSINENNIHVFIPGQNGVPLPRKVIAGKPQVNVFIDIPQVTPGVSFLRTIAKVKNPVLSAKPTTVILKPENLKVIVIGKDSNLPKVYNIIEPEIKDSAKINYSVQYGDTIFQAVSKIFPQPVQREGLLPRYKNDAICNLQYLDVEQGLAFSSVWAIIEDKHSNMWFGTDGGGVSKYDGRFFTNYTIKEGLSDDIIRSMLEDRNGNIWFGTWKGGVDKFDGKTFTHFAKREGFCNSVVRAMMLDKKGDIWFATLGSGVYKYDDKNLTLTHYTKEQGLSSDSIFSLIQDKLGNIWFGTANCYLCKFDGESFTQFAANKDFGSVTVRAIAEDKEGNLWFSSDSKGLFKYDLNRNDTLDDKQFQLINNQKKIITKNDKPTSTLTQFTTNQGLTDNSIFSILFDKTGNIWLGSNKGVCKFDGNSFSYYTEKEGLNSNYIRSALKDRVGNLWFGTHGGGVCRYISESFEYITELEGLSNRRVWSMLEDKDHNLWFGTWEGGVCKFDGKVFTCYTEAEGLVNNNVRSIIQDRLGNMWFATENGGVSKFDGKYFTNYTEEQGIGKNKVRKIIEDRKGNIWFGTYEGGLTKYDGNRVKAIENGANIPENEKLDLVKINGKYVESIRSYTQKDGLSFDVIWDLLEDKDGIIWIGTSGGGLSKFDGNSFVNYTVKEGLCDNYIRSLLSDDNGNIWIGTNGGGVSIFNGQTFTNITEKDGLNSNYVRSLLKDRNGNIWIGTISGFTYIRSSPNNKSRSFNNENIDDRQIYNFGQEDGLKGIELFPNSILLDSKNHLWVGSGKALNTIDLNVFELPTTKPQIQLNSIKISDDLIDFYSYKTNNKKQQIKFSDIAPFYNYPINVALPYNLNYISFNYSATDWFSPSKVKYQYKLEGLDNEWSKITNRSLAEYRNITHGKYTFKVRALGLMGLWSDTFEYKFEIFPPWWLTWWFRILVAIFIIGSAVAFYYYRLNSLIHQREQLEIKVAERTRELKKANIELGVQQKEILAKNEEISYQAEDLKFNQDQLIIINKHLKTQKKELKEALKKLKNTQSHLLQSERHASIGILSSGLAHEINNPLNFIQGGIAAIDNYINKNFQGHEKDISPLINIVNTGIRRATEIIINLENFNKKSDTNSENCDIHNIIDNSLVMLHNKMGNRIEVQKKYTDDTYLLIGNEGDLHQAILNVLLNAVESIENKGFISIFTKIEKQKMEIQISDTGCGISKRNLAKITDPFFTTKDPGKGIGFGLSIAFNIIEEHNGTLDFQSEQRKGTKVVIRLPIK